MSENYFLRRPVRERRPPVEGGVPERREQKPVVGIKALRVVAVRLWHDVGGAQQCWFGDAGKGTAATPIVHQRIAEDVLADAHHHEPLSLGSPRQAGGVR